MKRWGFLGATTLLLIALLGCLFLVAETGRDRLRVTSEALHAVLARRILVGQLRQQMTAAALGCRNYLITGDVDHLAPVRAAGRAVNPTADRFIAAYAQEDPRVGESARRLRYLAGVQIGEMAAAITLHQQRGPDTALELVRAQERRSRTAQRFDAVAESIEAYEAALLRRTNARWHSQVAQARTLAIIGTIADVLLVAGAVLVALLALRQHRDAMASVAARRTELEGDARARAAQLHELYGHMQTVQEQERSRLARGLHDELGGLLLAARMDVTWLQQHLVAGDVTALRGRLQRVLEVLDNGIEMKRRVIEELRPTLLDNMGVIAAIRWQMGETCGRSGLECAGHFPDAEPPLTPRAAITLFRVTEEALLNVQRHAAARHVEVTLEITDDAVELRVRDDGRGIRDTELRKPQVHGLAGMQHRVAALGGRLTAGRAAGSGTEVRAVIPRSRAFAAQP